MVAAFLKLKVQCRNHHIGLFTPALFYHFLTCEHQPNTETPNVRLEWLPGIELL